MKGALLAGGGEDPNNPSRTIFVPDVALFLLRGVHLDKVNYLEYLSVVQFENTPMPKNSTGATKPRSLKSPSRFELSPLFEGFADCRHSICLNQKIFLKFALDMSAVMMLIVNNGKYLRSLNLSENM